MTKIFIETDEEKEPWYDNLSLEYSYLWDKLRTHCNKGGLFPLSKRSLTHLAKFNVDIELLKENYEGKITITTAGNIFIHNYLANQNTLFQNIANDAVKGRLKTAFSDPEIDEYLLRGLGYKFNISFKGEESFEVFHIEELLEKYSKIPKEKDNIDQYFLNSEPMGKPMGKPRNSNSISKGKSNIIEDTRELTYSSYKKELVNLPNIGKIEKQLTENEFNKLLNVDSPKKVTKERFWEAVDALENGVLDEINDSVYISLRDHFELPF